METVGIHEAKTHFSKLIQRALAGEEIVIARGKQPLVKLTPVEGARQKRELGRCKNLVKWVAPDFDEPLEEFESFMR